MLQRVEVRAAASDEGSRRRRGDGARTIRVVAAATTRPRTPIIVSSRALETDIFIVVITRSLATKSSRRCSCKADGEALCC